MAFRKDRVKPAAYPKLPFHTIRSAQLVSSIVVASITSYFLDQLAHDGYRMPWTFLLLMAVSLLTIAALVTTIILHCLYGLNPTLNIVVNSSLAVLWSVAFSLLSWWSSGTLTHVCNTDNWDTAQGISVCRLYKVLFSFSSTGLVATVLALGLDIYVQRTSTARGRFELIQMHGGEGSKAAIIHEQEHERYDGDSKLAVTHKNRQGCGEDHGYALPEGQFAYDDDTAYRGAAYQVERRSFERRT